MLVVLNSGVARGDSLPDVIDAVRGSIVGIGTMYPSRQPNISGNTSSLHGTGFVVGTGRQIITNAHVLPQEIDSDNQQTLAVFAGRGPSVKAYPAKVIKVDEMHDLAILEIRGDPLPALTLGDSSSVREGQKVAFTGFPIGAVLGLFPVTHRGIVSVITPMARPADGARSLSAAQLRRMRNPFDAFQLDATAYPGNSGSPVYEPDTGKVIGILNSVFVKESRETIFEKPSGISYAIPVVHLREMLDGPFGSAVK
ncbi:MAG: S1-C subfamily serine protease [Bacteroidia bacterium]|jgi:serine protease Do